MAEKLSIQIALDGGKEVERQLADIGEAGKKAFADISAAAEQVGGFQKIDPSIVTDKLREMGVTGIDSINKIQDAVRAAGRLEEFVLGIAAVEKGFDNLGNAVDKFGIRLSRSLGPLGVFARALGPMGVALGVLGGAFVKAAFDVGKAVGDISEQAAKLGLTTQQFDGLRATLEKGGISSQAITEGMQHLQGVLDKLNLDRVNKSFEDLSQIVQTSGAAFLLGSTKLEFLKQTADGVGPAADAARDALKKLGQISPFKPLADSLGPVQKLLKDAGLSVEEFSQTIAKTGKATPEQFQAIANALTKIPDETQRLQVATSLLGDKLGRQLVSALKTGALAVDDFRKQIGALTPDEQRVAEESEQAVNRMATSWSRLKTQMGLFAAPIIVPFFEAISDQLQKTRKDLITIGEEFATFKRLIQFFIDNPKLTIELALKMTGVTDQIDRFMRLWQFFVDNPKLTLELAIKSQIDAFRRDVENLWNDIKQGASDAWDALKPFTGTIDAAVFGFIQKQAETAWTAIKNGVQTAHDSLVEIIGQPVAGAWQWIVDTFNAAIVKLQASAALQSIRDIVLTPIEGAWQWIVDTFNSIIGQLPALTQTAITAITQLVTTPIGGAWQWLVDTFTSVIEQIKQKAQAASDFIKGLGSEAPSPETQSSFGGGMAGGGIVGGRGTGTSDSNLAWISRGEHIMPARVVAQPGVLALLEALRRSGGNLRAVLDDLAHFSLGGMVPRTIPAFAQGGLAAAMSNVTIQFPGLPPISGLKASSDTVEELRRAAAMAQVRSGGRKPSRYS